MRAHAEIKELLAIYDRLLPEELAEVNAHIAMCVECADELAACIARQCADLGQGPGGGRLLSLDRIEKRGEKADGKVGESHCVHFHYPALVFSPRRLSVHNRLITRMLYFAAIGISSKIRPYLAASTRSPCRKANRTASNFFASAGDR